MESIKKNIFICLVLAFFSFVFAVFLPFGPFSKEETLFKIEKGEGSKEIAHSLEKEKMIPFAPLFRIYVLITGKAGKLQAGSYLMNTHLETQGKSTDIESIIKFLAQEGIELVRISEALSALEEAMSHPEGEDLPSAEISRLGTALGELLSSRGITLDRSVLDNEVMYLRLRPFHWAWVLYLISFHLMIFASFGSKRKKRSNTCSR